METPRNTTLEFFVIIGLLVAAVIFGYHLDFSSLKKVANTPTGKSADTPPGKNTPNTPEAQAWKEGRALFKANCAACHNPKADGTGPALVGAVERWKAAGTYQGKTGEEWLRIWIKNWKEPVEAGHKYAVEMANSRISAMNLFATTLTDAQIEQILLYTEDPGKYSAPVSPAAVPR